jgi:hypothetical protein
MLTEKVVFCLVVVPILWAFYGVVLLCMTDLDRPTVALIMMTIPLFAYIGIVVTEAGMVDMKDLRPYFMRLFPSARKRLAVLPETRMALQTDLRAFIKSIGTLRPKHTQLLDERSFWSECYLFFFLWLTNLLVSSRAGIGGHLLLEGSLGLEDDPRKVVQVDQARRQGSLTAGLDC